MSFFNILYAVFIGPLQLFFEVIYSIAYRVIGNPGLCIIVLSLSMNFLVLPLYKRADEMQAQERDIENKLKRGIDHIKKTFKGDDRMMMLQTYYRQNNYSPLSALKGSVSLLLEIPFFIAAYEFLSGLELLQGVSFGPLKNLGEPDGLLVIGSVAINVLPILMTAINLISSAIYTKGSPAKTKVQLYVMALFFLVFLYKSPSGLVFYWTLNNLFSLVKTIFFKLKNASFILACMAAVAGVGAIGVAVVRYATSNIKIAAVLIILGLLLEIPIILTILKKKGKKLPEIKAIPCKRLFVTTGILLSVLVGLLIPSAVINDSPLEFVNSSFFYNPVWYIVNAMALAVGTFLVWFNVFYSLAGNVGKVIFERILVAFSVVAIADYMFFGKDLGIMSSSLIFDTGMSYSAKSVAINLSVVAAVSAVMVVAAHFLKKKLAPVMLIAGIAIAAMGIVNINGIAREINKYNSVRREDGEPEIALSQNGQNVVYIMLDRAMGLYLPYIFNELPELKEQFDGFVYYDNVVSYAGFTNMATPAMFGGYEYTPEKLNKRINEPLMDKHNEALSVLPVMFADNGYDVTLFNPSYANYQWIPDVSYFDQYEGVNAYLTYGKFISTEQKEFSIKNSKRNFFCYSLMKTMPLLIQPTVYDAGAYNSLSFYTEEVFLGQTGTDKSHAEGLRPEAMDYFYTMDNLSEMTKVLDDDSNNYFMYVCELAHDVMLYQEPEYEPSMNVDNAEFDAAHADRFTLDGKTLKFDTYDQMAHYESNVVALKKLGEWLEYLKENDLYDNTRIIIVADHGSGMKQVDDCMLDETNLDNPNMRFTDGMYADASAGNMYDMNFYYPLMLFKDFESTGFSVNSEFMTNADVPTMLTHGIIDNPVNPFTGNPINSDAKTNDGVYILISDGWGINANNGSVFFAGDWVNVSDDMRIKSNWRITQQNSTSPHVHMELDMELWTEMRKLQGY